MAEQEQGSRNLPALYRASKYQIGMTGGTLLLSGVVDVAMHNPGVALVGLFVTGAVGYMSKDILDMMVPGSNGAQVADVTTRVINAVDPEEEDDLYKDQSPLAKMKRLVGMKTPPLEYAPGEQIVMAPAQPKDERVMPPAQNASEEEDDGPVFPVGPEQETLRLGKVLKTGQRFDPSFRKLFGRGWVAAANQGFGKSILNGVIIEQAGKCGLRVIVLDHKGEYGTVEELPFMNTLRAGAGSDFDFQLTPDTADRFVESVMVNRYQAMVDLPSYGDGWLDRAQIVAAVGQALMRYANRQRAANRKMKQCLIILDEAQLYLPQNAGLLPAEASRNQGVLSDLNNAYFSLVSNGRSAGYTLGFATQSLTYLAKWAIKSTGVKIFGRHIERNDLNAIQEDVDPGVASRKELASFPPGVGVVFGFTDEAMVVQFDHKQSRDVSFTPGFDDPYEDEEDDEVEQFLSFADDVDPDDDRYDEDEEEVEPLTSDLQAVYDVYRQYMSDRKIAQVLGTTHATIGKKRERLIAMGYIDRKTGARLV